MNVLLTGGTGYLGRNLTEMLSSKGFVLKNIYRAPFAKNELDLDSISISEFALSADVFIHVAGDLRPSHPIDNFNVISTRKISQFCKKYEIPKLILISSAGVFKGSNEARIDEFSIPMPKGIYEKSKYHAEQIAASELQYCNVKLVIIRPATIFSSDMENNKLRQILWLTRFGIPIQASDMSGIANLTPLRALLKCVRFCCLAEFPESKTILHVSAPLSYREIQLLGQTAIGSSRLLRPLSKVWFDMAFGIVRVLRLKIDLSVLESKVIIGSSRHQSLCSVSILKSELQRVFESWLNGT